MPFDREDAMRSRLGARVMMFKPYWRWGPDRILELPTHRMIEILKEHDLWLKFCEWFSYDPEAPLGRKPEELTKTGLGR